MTKLKVKNCKLYLVSKMLGSYYKVKKEVRENLYSSFSLRNNF